MVVHWNKCFPHCTVPLWFIWPVLVEWKNILNKHICVSPFRFLPFSGHRVDKYVPSIQTASKYGQSSYGLKHFREEHPEKWITNKVSYVGKPKQSYSFVDFLKISKSIRSTPLNQFLLKWHKSSLNWETIQSFHESKIWTETPLLYIEEKEKMEIVKKNKLLLFKKSVKYEAKEILP